MAKSTVLIPEVLIAGPRCDGNSFPDSPFQIGLVSNAGIEPCDFHESGIMSKTNQDRAFAAFPLFPLDKKHKNDWIGAGVCDGLGLYGDLISHFAANEIMQCLRHHPLKTVKPLTALRDAFTETDGMMRTHAEIKRSAVSSGTTACVVMMCGSTLWIANCGDSGAVMGTKRHKKQNNNNNQAQQQQSEIIPRKLTREHTPTDLTERARCIKKGAYISQPTEPGLADARFVLKLIIILISNNNINS